MTWLEIYLILVMYLTLRNDFNGNKKFKNT
jgi:hypothetical protein